MALHAIDRVQFLRVFLKCRCRERGLSAQPTASVLFVLMAWDRPYSATSSCRSRCLRFLNRGVGRGGKGYLWGGGRGGWRGGDVVPLLAAARFGRDGVFKTCKGGEGGVHCSVFGSGVPRQVAGMGREDRACDQRGRRGVRAPNVRVLFVSRAQTRRLSL